jgi:hypothetical protein
LGGSNKLTSLAIKPCLSHRFFNLIEVDYSHLQPFFTVCNASRAVAKTVENG